MRFAWAPLGVVFCVSSLAILAASSASCSDKSRPDAGDFSQSDGAGTSSGGDGSSAADADPDAQPLPATCANTIRDGQETDVDCGGAVCAQAGAKCIDGKTCVNNDDCAGGSCINNVCFTAACSDGVRNGDESDTDCGGKTCAKCTIGKRCTSGTDCVSLTCEMGTQACACPKGMAIISKSTGGAYCIDEVEVTKGQYNKFITANVSVNDQITECKAPINTTFIPRGAWPPATVPPGPPEVQPNGLAFSLSLPVHYVDWCDAFAYCKWANKQLCGKINGGAITRDAGADPSVNAWYNACSAQGTKTWPYGTAYVSAKCNARGDGGLGPDPQVLGGQGYGYAVNQDDGLYRVVESDFNGNYTIIQHAECQGGAVGLYHMSGNVAEWEDACDGTGPIAACALRGGSYNTFDDPNAVTCGTVRTEQRMPISGDVLKDVGFRCCLY